MTQINSCLRCIFIIFNIIFAIVGAFIFGIALLAQFFADIHGVQNLEVQTTGLLVLYIVGAITMVVAILGAYGAHRESKVALMVFLLCMILGFLLMLRNAVLAAIMRPKLDSIMDETFHKFFPLDKSSDTVKSLVEGYQITFRCCGLFSYKDWEDIPTSCVCSREEVKKGECQTAKNSLLQILVSPETSVYTKTCFPIILEKSRFDSTIRLAVSFTLAVLALLGIILSSVMIQQMHRLSRPPVLLQLSPRKYEELHNPAAC
ncbi:tetraspanin-8-like [Archocentrus centrarchus]|uniref:tetraspanin-8-like n=1 Tax=Archocentrus centrarchus TaxID=63155 RepID=UPI0011E9C785|nr:tetraspanin-8-like [Archocentrus centrarchus]XP_030575949.1 tetraspanin-8-like [Archocentrus centrarchus]